MHTLAPHATGSQFGRTPARESESRGALAAGGAEPQGESPHTHHGPARRTPDAGDVRRRLPEERAPTTGLNCQRPGPGWPMADRMDTGVEDGDRLRLTACALHSTGITCHRRPTWQHGQPQQDTGIRACANYYKFAKVISVIIALSSNQRNICSLISFTKINDQ